MQPGDEIKLKAIKAEDPTSCTGCFFNVQAGCPFAAGLNCDKNEIIFVEVVS